MSEEKNSTLHSQNSKLIRSSAAEYLTFVASTGESNASYESAMRMRISG